MSDSRMKSRARPMRRTTCPSLTIIAAFALGLALGTFLGSFTVHSPSSSGEHTATIPDKVVPFIYNVEGVSQGYNVEGLISRSDCPTCQKCPTVDTHPNTHNLRSGAPTTLDPSLSKVGLDGGAWTAQTHLSIYGFNADSGLIDLVEESCRYAEDKRNAEAGTGTEWHQTWGERAPGLWEKPKLVDCRVLEFGTGVGVYADSLKKNGWAKNRKIIGIEPNEMGGTFDRDGGPKQLAINILSYGEEGETGEKAAEFVLGPGGADLGGEKFDFLYSIEVCEHLPLESHKDAALFFAKLSRPGTKLMFGAGHPGQAGTGHIGLRKVDSWREVLESVGFIWDGEATKHAKERMITYNHKANVQVFWFQGESR